MTPPPPPKKKSFWSSPGGIVTIIFGSGALLFAACGGLLALSRAGEQDALRSIKVTLDSCETEDLLDSATVSYSVTNAGTRDRRVRLEIEYRDSSGARLDTDTAYVGEVPAGDTVRGRETTLLNARPAGRVTCRIVKVS